MLVIKLKKNKIPKVIHYCWFGGNEIPKEYLDNIESWKKFCPDYEIKRWDESNYDINKCKFIKEAYDIKKWAFVTDYARLDIVYNYGGIYLDTDVEIVKNFDDLLDNDCFMGIECGNLVNTGIGFGAVKYNNFIKENKEYYEDKSIYDDSGNLNLINCPVITSKILKDKGALLNNKIEIIDNVKIYPEEYFCPMNYFNGKTNITNNTYSIHKYSMSWGSKYEKRRSNLKRKLAKVFGVKLAEIICKLIFLPRKIICKIKG